ncbi:MAG TPA: hypothetical protein VFG10_04195 [Saprospiraceae bacterium]|nr:hypothetical protein [Saprospiraceae bacterium]
MKYLFSLLIISLSAAGCTTARHSSKENDGLNYLILNPAIRFLDFDPLGNLYILDETDRVSKYDTTGKLLFHVVNNNLGEAHSIDVGNPFKTMVFYRDQQTILLYDRTLSEIQRIRLAEWKLHDITAACLSPDNALWMFDGTNRVLIKSGDDGNALLTSDPFDIIAPASVRPDFIYDLDHFLLLKETSHPVSVFDDFGKFIYNVEIPVEEFFSVSSPFVITGTGNEIQMYDIAERKFLTPVLVKTNVENNRIYKSGNKYYATDGKGIYILTEI